MTKKDFTLTHEHLKECLIYNKDTGVFIWKSRPAKHFGRDAGMNIFNARFAGKKAGTVSICDNKPYIQIRINGHSYTAHRLAVLYVTGRFPDDLTDHEDGNGLNNKWDNLRNVTSLENNKNMRLRSDNKSGCTVVSMKLKIRKWMAMITVSGERIFLGEYKDFFEACSARKSAENKHGFHPNHGSIRPL